VARKRKVNRGRTRNKGKRGHIGQATQWALRTPEAKALALLQGNEILISVLAMAEASKLRKAAKEAKRIAMKGGA
jgi:hypothetical protein